MIISNIFERIRHCLMLSESMHLSNNEEEHIILELVRNFRKLIKQVLTKNELNHFKHKVKLIKHFNHLETLKNYINQKKQAIPWQPYLSLLSNIRLKLNSNSENTIELIFNDLMKKLTKQKNQRLSNSHHYIIEHKKTDSWADTVDFFQKLISKIKEEGINKIIIKTHSFCTHEQPNLMNLFELLSNHLGDGILIIELSDIADFNQAFEVIQHISGMNSNLNYGLSFSISDRKTIHFIDHVFKTLTKKQRERFILRVKKGRLKTNKDQIISYQQQVTLNTYYKWSTYTIVNYVRKNNCSCIINSNNLHDISWILARRAQMNMEKTIQFETNISKFPNISKVLYTVNQASIPTESLFITNNSKEKLNILLDKLIHQGHIYHGYKNSPFTQKIIFIKSQRRFFNFLRRNYLEKYLNKYKSSQQKN
tara:strand:+ start:1145 stop:2413 length:1269 start_codon:yes stop_codon:yes gene_type:complete